MSSAVTRAIILIKQFEGCRLRAYQDECGIWTIGYGATGPLIKVGVVWTQAQAEADLLFRVGLLDTDLTKMARTLILSVGGRAALLSFVYNLGLGELARSTLWAVLVGGSQLLAAMEFQKFSMDNGKRIRGLLRRRFVEAAEFLS